MDPFSALSKVVKPDLEGAFGFGGASVVLVAARKKCGTPSSGMNRGDYIKLVKAVSEDAKVIEKWGAGVKEKLSKWTSAVD